MKVFEAIQARRSVKQFNAQHKMSEAELNELIALAMLSPTAFNIQHWRFVSVEDKALREQVRAVSWNQAQVTDASALIVLVADTQAWAKDPARYWQNAPQATRDFMLPAIQQFYQDKPQMQRDEALRSCGMAAMTLMLAAQQMGYDSCPMDGFDFDAVSQLLNLPADHIPVMFVAIGKAVQPAWPRAGQLDISEVLIRNRFS
jgi:nitroreductase